MRSMPYWRTFAQRSWNSGLLVSTLLCGGGAAGFERRSGGCWVSQGTWLFSGGRGGGRGGLTPRMGSAVVPTTPGSNCTRFVPPDASTRNHWPLASPERLSPARPGNGLRSSVYTYPGGGHKSDSLRLCAYGRTTSFWQLADWRISLMTGTESRVNRASDGIVGCRSAAYPRSS